MRLLVFDLTLITERAYHKNTLSIAFMAFMFTPHTSLPYTKMGFTNDWKMYIIIFTGSIPIFFNPYMSFMVWGFHIEANVIWFAAKWTLGHPTIFFYSQKTLHSSWSVYSTFGVYRNTISCCIELSSFESLLPIINSSILHLNKHTDLKIQTKRSLSSIIISFNFVY